MSDPDKIAELGEFFAELGKEGLSHEEMVELLAEKNQYEEIQ